MQLKSVFLPHSVPEKRLLTLVLSCIVLFFLPHPVLGQITITVNTTLTANNINGIVIGADNITLDCAGFMVSSSVSGDGVGIRLNTRTKVTVKNCHVHDFAIGFALNNSNKNKLRDNIATSNGDVNCPTALCGSGFVLFNSDKNKLLKNEANNNFRNGFIIVGSSKNTLTDNIATGNVNADGIQIFQGSNHTLVGNTTDSNGRNGILVFQSDDNTIDRNTADLNSANGFGIFDRRADLMFGIDGSDDNTITNNTADINLGNGFRVVGESRNNTLEANEGMGNGNFDALDDAIPAGFDNVWVDNVFGTTSGF